MVCLGAGEHDGVPYLVVEYCSRGTLRSCLANASFEFDYAKKLKLAHDVSEGESYVLVVVFGFFFLLFYLVYLFCLIIFFFFPAGMCFLHSRGCIHRDLKVWGRFVVVESSHILSDIFLFLFYFSF